MREFVWKAGHSAMEFVSPTVVRDAFRLSVFGSLSRHIRAHFRDERIVQLLEFPVLFLGTSAQSAPSLYSLMNYADIELGTWYPIGGMFKIIEGMMSVATQAGVTFQFDSEVDSIVEKDGRVAGVRVGNGMLRADAVVAAADYHHVEQQLLPATWRRYDQPYWDKRKMSPSALVFYIGVNRRLPGLEHHNLFFDVPFEPHADAILLHPRWPRQPLFYVAAPSRTDPSVAPDDCENLFVLIPVASGLHEREGVRDEMFETIMSRLEQRLGVDIRQSIVYRRDYAHAEFEADYGAFRGNAYGLANTLGQTAFLKPKLRSRLPGLFFAGQLTTPGPGVPPCLISGQIAAREASQWLARNASQTVGAA